MAQAALMVGQQGSALKGEERKVLVASSLGTIFEAPAVIITADHTAEVQRTVRSHGFAILRKPLKAGALRALLTQYAPRRMTAAE